MRRLRALRSEQGSVMILVVVLGVMLSAVAVALLDGAAAESHRSGHDIVRQASFEAAEAGVDDYIAKLVDDHMYYAHSVHPAESTRRAPSGALTAPGAAWTGGLAWTYPNGHDAWRQLPDGYEYNLQVTPPSAASKVVDIVATGRRTGTTTDTRAVEVLVRPSSVADYQMLANADISYGAGATTYGKIYAGIDSHGVAHDVNHDGTAFGDIYAEGSVSGSVSMQGGARKYDHTNIRSIIKNPVNFGSFLTSLVDIQRAAQAGGIYLNNTSVNGWRLTFQPNGTVDVQQCTRYSGQALAAATPTCVAATPANRAVPSNGAIYSAQPVIVSGQVKGRVTVAANDDVIVANNISYVQTGSDVLGLVAASDVLVAQWAPTDLSWRAATIAQTGAWRSWSNDGSHGTMTFTGSTATNLGGSMTMFQTRVYQYDDSLAYLQPPWFPTLDDAFTVVLFRELPSP